MNQDRLTTITNSQLKEGYKQTEVGIIPEDWETVLLDKVAARGSGHTPDKKITEYWNGDIKWISLKDCDCLDKLYIFDTSDKVTKAGIANSSAVIHPCGTVVLSRDAGVGKSSIMSEDMAVSQHFMAWQCGETLNNIFLYYWLQSKKKEFERIAIGNTIKTIGLGYFKQLNIPHPPLTEQEAIASTLSDIDALIESLDQLLLKKRQIKQGAMQELLRSKDGWTEKRLGDIAHIQTGSRNNQDKVEDGEYPLFVRSATVERINIYSYECEAILIPGEGGIGSIFHYINGRFDAHQRVYVIRQFSEEISGKYVYLYMSKNFGFHAMQNSVKATVDSLRLPTFQNFQIFVPSTLEEQIEIANILSDMDAEIESISAKLTKTRQLKQGMMHELLTGRIRLVES